jgi:SAM-dependent methyltransferase
MNSSGHELVELLKNEYIRQPSAERRIGILDLRKVSQNGRIESSLCIEEGLQGLKERFSWLPPRIKKQDGQERNVNYAAGKRLIVFCNLDGLQEVNAALDGWDVAGFITENDTSFWKEASESGLLKKDTECKCVPDLLFEPSELARVIVKKFSRSQEDTETSPVTLLDLGCGAGRDLAWIARNASTGWRLAGIDNLYSIVRRARLLVKDMKLAAELDSEEIRSESNRSSIESIIWAQVSSEGSLQALRHATEGSTANHGIPILSRNEHESVHQSLVAFAMDHLPHRTFDILFLVRFFPIALLYHLPALSHVGGWIAISHFTTVTDLDEQEAGRIVNSEQVNRTYPGPPIGKRFELEHIASLLEIWEKSTGTNWTIVHHHIIPCEDGRPLRNVIFCRTR